MPAARPDARRGSFSPIRQAIDDYLRESGMSSQLRSAQVFEAWRQAAGPVLARRARPVRFRRGELVVEVGSAPHLHELESFTGENYRRAANASLGDERIERMTFCLKQ